MAEASEIFLKKIRERVKSIESMKEKECILMTIRECLEADGNSEEPL